MDKTLATILGSAGLPDEIVAGLQEAFDAKVAETRGRGRNVDARRVLSSL